MKSDAPLKELRRIVRISDEAGRVHALSEWIDNHTASCVAQVAISGLEYVQSADLEDLKSRHHLVAVRNVAHEASKLATVEEDRKRDCGVLGVSDTVLSSFVSLRVIVPEGVEHPRKRQERERAEREAKEAAAP